MSDKNRALLFDSIFFLGLVIFSEWIGAKALKDFYSGYYFSISLLASFILMYRWGIVGVLLSVATGIISVLFMNHADLGTLLIYGLGNAGIISSYFFMMKITKQKLKSETGLTIPYVLVGYLSIVIIRGVIMAFMGEDLLSACFLVLSNEMLNIIAVTLFTTLLMKQKSIMIDLITLYQNQEV